MIPGFLIAALTFPGVIVHEFAHYLFCRLTNTVVVEVCYFRFGNPAGYVVHYPPDNVWKHILISVGPFIVNTFAGAAIGLVAASIPPGLEHPEGAGIVLLWLAVSVAMHAFPSTGDAASIWGAIWAPDAPILAWLLGLIIVPIIGLGAIGSIFWLDLIYGMGVVYGTASLCGHRF